MLTAYLDESGTGKKERLCAVSGFVGNEAQWAAFAADWIPALGQRKNLHMTQLPWKRRYELVVKTLARLGPIPHRYNLSPVSVWMWHSDHEQAIQGVIRDQFTTPYLMCANACIATVLSEIAGPKDEVLFILDRQEGKRAKAMESIYKIAFKWAKLDPRVKDINFLPRHVTVCLDPADYLAFHTREWWTTDGKSDKAKAGMPIVDSEKPLHGGVFALPQLRVAAEALAEPGISEYLYQALAKAGWNLTNIEEFRERMRKAKDEIDSKL